MHRRNIPPGTPRGPPLAVCHEPVRSGLPLGSRGCFLGRRSEPAAAGLCIRRRDDETEERRHARREPRADDLLFAHEPRSSSSRSTPCGSAPNRKLRQFLAAPAARTLCRNGHDHVHLADFGHHRLQVAHDHAVAPLDDRARVHGFDPVQRVVEVLEVAVDELRRISPVRHHDAFRKEALVERGRRRGPGDSRDRKREDGPIALPFQRRRPFHTGGSLAVEQRGRILGERLRERHARRGGDGGLGCAVRACPQTDQPLLERGGPGRGLALAGDDFRAGNVLVPGVLPADRFDVGKRLAVRARALDLRPVSRRLVVRADAILRQRARLSVHLNRALGLVFERAHELGLGLAAQHSHVPRPVEEDRLQVAGARLGRVGRRPAEPASAALCAGGQHAAHARRRRRAHTPRQIFEGTSQLPAPASSGRQSTMRSNARSPSSRRRMNPAGLPFLAGRAVILRLSPTLMEDLLTPCAGQHLYGGGGQHPLRRRAVRIRNREMQARVRIHEVQFRELALQDDLLVEVVHTRHRMMCLQLGADHQESAECDQPNRASVHRCQFPALRLRSIDPSQCAAQAARNASRRYGAYLRGDRLRTASAAARRPAAAARRPAAAARRPGRRDRRTPPWRCVHRMLAAD